MEKRRKAMNRMMRLQWAEERRKKRKIKDHPKREYKILTFLNK